MNIITVQLSFSSTEVQWTEDELRNLIGVFTEQTPEFAPFTEP